MIRIYFDTDTQEFLSIDHEYSIKKFIIYELYNYPIKQNINFYSDCVRLIEDIPLKFTPKITILEKYNDPAKHFHLKGKFRQVNGNDDDTILKLHNFINTLDT